jgi:hypothetical protein
MFRSPLIAIGHNTPNAEFVSGYELGEHQGARNEGLAEKDQASPSGQPISYFSSDTGRPASQSER